MDKFQKFKNELETNEMELGLKSCPFCGGEAEIEQISRNTLIVKCTKCRISLKGKVLKYSLEWLRSELAKLWNRRVI